VRHGLWGLCIAVPGLAGFAAAVVRGDRLWAAISGVVVGAAVGFVWAGWRLERDADRRMAELMREYDARFRARSHARENGGKVRR
jgi:hypothetical protein